MNEIRIPNKHIEDCGTIPSWINEEPDGNHRFGYFENEHGEQWVVLIEPHRIRLAGGDIGWDRVHQLDNPNWKDISWLQKIGEGQTLASFPKGWPQLVLAPYEQTWLASCVMAAASVMGYCNEKSA